MRKSLGARTFAYPLPVWLVGTYDETGRANVMTASWAGICCSKPPCVNVSLRRATYTYAALEKRRAFTISIPTADQVKQADYFGIASGRSLDKIAQAGMTPARSERVDAPFLEECPVVLECRLVHAIELGLHTLFVGEVLDVKAVPGVLGSGGDVDPSRLDPFAYVPEAQSYWRLGERLGRAFSIGRDPAPDGG
jgi:flavin reductase (DIM6/NTAB) family NADH-FMN oxidoreductase RutF